MSAMRSMVIGTSLFATACFLEKPDRYDGPRYRLDLPPRDASLSTADGGVDDDGDAAASDTDPPDAPDDSDGSTSPAPDAAPPVECSIELTTRSPAGRYANAYVCAIWIADAEGALVRTLAYYAGPRGQYLSAYRKVRNGATLDATAHATINSSRSKEPGRDQLDHQLTWALDDLAGEPVPAGEYTLHVETTSSNTAGAVVSTSFELGAQPVDLTPEASDNVSALSIRCR
jgi:hypothetical protein